MRERCRVISIPVICYIVMSPEDGRVAQLGERCVRNAEAGSSTLPTSTTPPSSATELGVTHCEVREKPLIGPPSISTTCRYLRYSGVEISVHECRRHPGGSLRMDNETLTIT